MQGTSSKGPFLRHRIRRHPIIFNIKIDNKAPKELIVAVETV